MARVEKICLRPFRRTAVISDIHGELSYLKGLLEKLALTEEDALIFLGDMVEKGPESLATLRCIMALRVPILPGRFWEKRTRIYWMLFDIIPFPAGSRAHWPRCCLLRI